MKITPDNDDRCLLCKKEYGQHLAYRSRCPIKNSPEFHKKDRFVWSKRVWWAFSFQFPADAYERLACFLTRKVAEENHKLYCHSHTPCEVGPIVPIVVPKPKKRKK